jgi:hypothetical protein
MDVGGGDKGMDSWFGSMADCLPGPVDIIFGRPGQEAAGKPASSTSTPNFSSWVARRNFSAVFMLAPGDCSPSLKVVSNMITRSVIFFSSVFS